MTSKPDLHSEQSSDQPSDQPLDQASGHSTKGRSGRPRDRHSSDDDIYASGDLSAGMPKRLFPAKERAPRAVYAAIHDELMLDGNSRQNLATFCQTWLEPEVHQLMNECIDKNMEDKDEYPQTAEIEARCARMLADLWNAPSIDGAVGCTTLAGLIQSFRKS